MEQINNGEQLEILKKGEDGANKQSEKDMAQNLSETGSLTKFNSVSELEKAYVNLEKEFTKKCQALNKLQNSDNDEKKNSSPQNFVDYEKLNKFFVQNPDAKQFADEILSELESDKVDLGNSIDRAFEKVKANHFKSNEQILNDADFVENYILNNKTIKDKILSEYLNEIVSNRPTTLMDMSGGANVMLTPVNKPKTIKEAGNYLASIIGNK